MPELWQHIESGYWQLSNDFASRFRSCSNSCTVSCSSYLVVAVAIACLRIRALSTSTISLKFYNLFATQLQPKRVENKDQLARHQQMDDLDSRRL